MVLDAKKAYKNLKKKGFIDSPDKSNDHKYLDYVHDGKLVCYTKISHGGKTEIDDYLIKQMSSQCLIDKINFAGLINCNVSEADYINLLREKGEID